MKKRFLSILLCVCMALTLLPTAALAAADLLVNPDGETVANGTYGVLNQNGWTEDGTARGYSYDGFNGAGNTAGIVLVPHGGSYFMGFFADSGTCYQDVTVTAGMKGGDYTLTGYLAAKNGTGATGATSAVLKLEQLDSSDKVISGSAKEESVSAVADWTKKTLTGTVSADAVKLRVSITGTLAVSVKSLAAFDDLSLTVTEPVYAITKANTVNGSFTVSAESATAGTTVTVTPSPDSGYMATVTAAKTGEAATKISVSGNSFIMPTHAVTVTVSFSPAFSGGSGTSADPWQIGTKDDLVTLAAFVNDGSAAAFDKGSNDYGNFNGYYFKQTADIDLTDVTWEPIGYSGTYYFAGNYDGGGFTVSNMKCTGKVDTADGAGKNTVTAGLFGWAAFGSIKNVCIENAELTATANGNFAYAGGITAVAYSAQVSNCSVSDSKVNAVRIPAQSAYAGGICGITSVASTFDNCLSVSNMVSSVSFSGGVVGTCDNSNGTNPFPIAQREAAPFWRGRIAARPTLAASWAAWNQVQLR